MNLKNLLKPDLVVGIITVAIAGATISAIVSEASMKTGPETGYIINRESYKKPSTVIEADYESKKTPHTNRPC